MNRVALAACFCVSWAVTCYAQTALRPDQIGTATQDLTWTPGGPGYQIGSIIPWRTDGGTTPALLNTDAAKVIELTNGGSISMTLPLAGAAGFGDGFGANLQTVTGTLTIIAGSGQTINGNSQIKLGGYQSVLLLSRGTKWYGLMSAPQPLTQSGITQLADSMAWVGSGAPSVITRNHSADLGASASNVTSYTASYTVNSASKYLLVGFLGDSGNANDDIISITYNTVPLSLIGKFTAGWANTANDRFLYLYGLSAPTHDGAAHNVVTTWTNPHYWVGVAADYSGVSSVAPLGTAVKNSIAYPTSGGAVTLTTNVAVPVTGSWVVLLQGIVDGTSTMPSMTSTNMTRVVTGAVTPGFLEPTLWDTNAPASTGTFPANLHSPGQTNGTSYDIYSIAVALQP